MAIKIYVKQFELDNTRINKFKIYLSLNIFNKLDLLKIKIDKTTLKKILNKNNKKVNLGNLKKDDIKLLISNIKVEKLNIYSILGTESPYFTSFLVPILSSILAILLAKVENSKYKIDPIYIDRNYLYLCINCIFTIKLVHIINISRKLKRKE